jgi:predicted P-loop ATPase
MLVLQGDQGLYKSTFVKTLFEPHFTDKLPALSNKDAAIALDGVWGVEIGEMSAWLKSTTADQNVFLSASFDKYRPPFERRDIIAPRQCVFIGTANPDQLFSDPTGTRRYDTCVVRKKVDLDAFASWGGRDQWWACAAVLEEAGEAIFAGPEEALEIQKANERHAEADPWESAVLAYAEKQRAAGVEGIIAEDALSFGVGISLDRQGKEELKRVYAILRRAYGRADSIWIPGKGTKSGYRLNPASR